MKLTKQHQEILAAMGILLKTLQTVEKLIKATIIIILPEDGIPLDLERLLAQDKKHARSVLGALLKELRKRADIDPSFDKILSEFLDMRNDFIHDLDRVPGFDLGTKEGRIVAINFINKLMKHTDTIMKMLFGLGRAWQKQNGIIFPEIDTHELVGEIDNLYAPLVNDIFYHLKEE